MKSVTRVGRLSARRPDDRRRQDWGEQGFTLVEIPVTLAAIGVIAAPILAAVSAIAGIVTKCTIVVERREPPPTTPPAS